MLQLTCWAGQGKAKKTVYVPAHRVQYITECHDPENPELKTTVSLIGDSYTGDKLRCTQDTRFVADGCAELLNRMQWWRD